MILTFDARATTCHLSNLLSPPSRGGRNCRLGLGRSFHYGGAYIYELRYRRQMPRSRLQGATAVSPVRGDATAWQPTDLQAACRTKSPVARLSMENLSAPPPRRGEWHTDATTQLQSRQHVPNCVAKNAKGDKKRSTTQRGAGRTLDYSLVSPVARRVAPNVASQLEPPQRLPLSVAKNAKRDTKRRRRDMTNKSTVKKRGPRITRISANNGRNRPAHPGVPSCIRAIRVISGRFPSECTTFRPHSIPLN